MYYLRPRGHYNVLLNDLKRTLRSYDNGIILTDEQFNKSLDIRRVEDLLIIMHINENQKDKLVKKELYYLNEKNQVVTLKEGKYKPNTGNMTVYINGHVANSFDFVEESETTVRILQPVDKNKNNTIVILQYVDSNIRIEAEVYIEQVSIEATDTIIKLKQKINDTENKVILLFIGGILQDPDCFYINEGLITLKQPLGDNISLTVAIFSMDQLK